ncbi:MAG: hypothetical protein D6744_12685 [Planctomycetota bacterium]|nr:MAG: hypothetical protein D6744_12685 [Planctomycetota bacterium]
MNRQALIDRRTLLRWGAVGGAACALRLPRALGHWIALGTNGSTSVHVTPFQAMLRFDGRPHEHAPMRFAASASESDSALSIDRDGEYRITLVELRLLTPDVIALTDGERTLWGPHALPAGTGVFNVGVAAGSASAGLRCGSGRAPHVSVAYGANGRLSVAGALVRRTPRDA